jgi:hypothetical protein
MSKITPKNLSYDSSLPPFLQRLQAHNSSLDDRHEFTVARPKKARNADEEAEDEPVYFDEGTGETLTKGEWEAREKENEHADGEKDGVEGDGKQGGNGREGKETEKMMVIGVTRKRKVGKIIGAEEEDEEESVGLKTKAKSKTASTSRDTKITKSTTDGKKAEKSKPAKKGKKIRLSFDD